MRNHNILPYSPAARDLSRRLRKNPTKVEIKFWKLVKSSSLNIVLRRQLPILDYVVDFYIKELGLAIEIDGKYHDDQFLEDATRQGRIEELGVRFMRFSNDDVLNKPNEVLDKLKSKIDELRT